jgi:hypothetical protein
VNKEQHLLKLATDARCEEIPKASVVPSSPILVTLRKEALSSSETPFLTRATRRNVPEDTILHSHRREDLKSYMQSVALLTEPTDSGTLEGFLE